MTQIEEGGIEDDGGAKVIDATGKYVLPGGVDPSVYAGYFFVQISASYAVENRNEMEQPSILFSFSLPVFSKPRKAQKNNRKFLFV